MSECQIADGRRKQAEDPGILVNIHAALVSYIAPGPPVYAGGSEKKAGSACTGCEQTCKVGAGAAGTALTVALPSATAAADGSGSTAGGEAACAVGRYQQCGGSGYTGCTNCAVSLPFDIL